MGPVSWTYPAEIFPMRARSKAVSLSTAVRPNCFVRLSEHNAEDPLMLVVQLDFQLRTGLGRPTCTEQHRTFRSHRVEKNNP